MAGAHSELVARFGLIVWRWHEASQNRERDESVLAAHVEAAATKTLRQEETLNAPDQKRAEISALDPTSAPVFCIWMLEGVISQASG